MQHAYLLEHGIVEADRRRECVSFVVLLEKIKSKPKNCIDCVFYFALQLYIGKQLAGMFQTCSCRSADEIPNL